MKPETLRVVGMLARNVSAWQYELSDTMKFGGSLPTLKDLSQHLGLSVTQVSRALNDHDDVSAATKERVREAAKLLNYQPNVMARRLVTGRSGVVGLIWQGQIVPSESWVFAQFVGGLTKEFDRLGLQFMLTMADDRARALASYERLIAGRSVDGFVLIMPEADDSRANLLQKRKMPFVVHGQTLDKPDYAFYDVDNFAIGYDLTRQLLDSGHRQIAFLNGPANASFVHRRREGYLTALQEAGVTPTPEYHVCGRMTSTFGMLETIRLQQGETAFPTGIIACNTLIAHGIIEAARILDLRVPHDLSLVVHDDCLTMIEVEDFPLPLTGTAAPLHEAWSGLADLLDAVIKGAAPAQSQRLAPHRIIKGESIRQL